MRISDWSSDVCSSDLLHGKFYDSFGDYCDRIFVENASPCWPDFNVEERMDIAITTGLYGHAIADVQTCPYLFSSISVHISEESRVGKACVSTFRSRCSPYHKTQKTTN